MIATSARPTARVSAAIADMLLHVVNNHERLRAQGSSIVMTYGYMRNYEDRVRRAVNTPDRNGRCALWQGGTEPNIPVGSEAGVAAGMKRAVAGGAREEREGASGKWVAHWKMVHIVRPVWENARRDNQLGREFPPLTHTEEDAAALVLLEPAPRTVRGARDLLSVALQYGNAFGRLRVGLYGSRKGGNMPLSISLAGE